MLLSGVNSSYTKDTASLSTWLTTKTKRTRPKGLFCFVLVCFSTIRCSSISDSRCACRAANTAIYDANTQRTVCGCQVVLWPAHHTPPQSSATLHVCTIRRPVATVGFGITLPPAVEFQPRLVACLCPVQSSALSRFAPETQQKQNRRSHFSCTGRALGAVQTKSNKHTEAKRISSNCGQGHLFTQVDSWGLRCSQEEWFFCLNKI